MILFVVVDLLFFVAPIVCGNPVFSPCFVMHYLVSFLVLQSSLRRRESWLLYFLVIVFLMSYDCKDSEALPHGALVGLKCTIEVFPDHTHLLFSGLVILFIRVNEKKH